MRLRQLTAIPNTIRCLAALVVILHPIHLSYADKTEPLSIVTLHPESRAEGTYGNTPSGKYRFSNRTCSEILKDDAEVIGCIPNSAIFAADLPNDPYIEVCNAQGCSCPLFDNETNEIIEDSEQDCQWSHRGEEVSGIDTLRAWETTTGDNNIIVAVLDSGVDYTHPDIASNMWVNPGEIAGNGIDDDNNGYIDDIHGINTHATLPLERGDPMDTNGHGTHVSGIIGAVSDNNIGIAGVAPQVKIMAVRILNSSGGGSLSNAIEGLEYVLNIAQNYNQNILVMNNSWGGNSGALGITNPNQPIGDNPLSNAFVQADNLQILSASAAGNDGEDNDLSFLRQFPAGLTTPNNIAVASTNVYGKISSFSNYGANTIHLAAPGESIRSLYLPGSNFAKQRGLENGTVVASGTSMATPQVAGILVLLKAAFPDFSYLELKDRLLNRVVPLRDLPDRESLITGGKASAYYALNDEEIPVPTPTPTPVPTPTPIPTPTPVATPTPTSTAAPDSGTNDPSASPTATAPSQDLPKLSYLVTIRGVKTKAKRKRFHKLASGKVFPSKRFEIQFSTVGLTFQSEELSLQFSFNGEQCDISPAKIQTSEDGNLILKGRMKRLMKSTKLFRVEALDSNNDIRGSATATVRHTKRSKRRGFKIERACKRIKLFQ